MKAGSNRADATEVLALVKAGLEIGISEIPVGPGLRLQ
jgi:hypothetical protein